MISGTRKHLLISGVFAAVLCSATLSNGQNRPRPLATPPVVTGAEIISRAGDLVPIEPRTVPGREGDQPDTSKDTDPRVAELLDRIKKLETTPKNDYDEKQKRLLLNLDILTRAEQRSESLRKQLFEMIEKENTVRSRIEQIEYDSRPEMIERTLQLAGSMRPEEIRESRRKSLMAERTNLQSLLSEIESTRASLNNNLQRSEIMVERLREKLEKDIEDSFLDTRPNN